MTEILSELHSENEILRDLSLGKNPKQTPAPVRSFHSSLPLQFSTQKTDATKITTRDLKAIDEHRLPSHQLHAMQYHSYLDKNGAPTLKLLHHVEKSAQPNPFMKDHSKASLLDAVTLFGPRWRDRIADECGLVEYAKACQLQKEGWFARDGVLSTRALGFLETQRDEQRAWLSGKLSAQHIGLMSLLASRNGQLTRETYYAECNYKTPWEVQESRIQWMQKHGILDANKMPTELGQTLRAIKTPNLTTASLNLRDTYIEKYLKLSMDDDTAARFLKMRPEEIESRIFRLKSSGLIDANGMPTPEFERACDGLRERAWHSTKPIWVLENRAPQLGDLNKYEQELVKTLATETPYISARQVEDHFGPEVDLRNLSQANVLHMRTLDVDGRQVKCTALNWGARSLTREMEIKKPLNGRFQRGSHVRHDLMLWEALQDFKGKLSLHKLSVESVTHERAIYAQKTSANDNKGVSTPDLVVGISTGDDVAIEYGNYAPAQMVKKVLNFPQEVVYVYSSHAGKLEAYKELYEAETKTSPVQKLVSWVYLPEISL